jgi:heat shock protein HslJ
MIKGRPVVDFSTASLRFNADGKMSGNASCNSLSASYDADGNNISLGEGAVTREMCIAALMEQENRMLAAMQDVRAARIENAMLYLEGEGGKLVYKAAPSIK